MVLKGDEYVYMIKQGKAERDAVKDVEGFEPYEVNTVSVCSYTYAHVYTCSTHVCVYTCIL